MSLKIAVLASNYIRLPPDAEFIPKGFSGAPERIMFLITEELVKRGHAVTLFASGDSKTNARLVSVTDKSTSLDNSLKSTDRIELEHLLIAKCYQMAQQEEFDIIHSIFDTRSAFYSGLVKTPTVSTLHSPLEGIKNIILAKIPATQYYVSISNNQRKSLPILNYIQTIYHGIEEKNFIYSENSEDFMLFAGRITKEKGIVEAISASQILKKKLYICGEYPISQEDFWKTSVEPHIDNKLIFHRGFLDKPTLMDFYQKSKLFLFPIQWEEPFGLVMIESMACGTPVVAYARGSVPEIVKDGETGFIVNSSDSDIRGDWIIKKTGFDGLCEAVEKIYNMPQEQYIAMRRNCRKLVEDKFTVGKMIDNYEQVYQQIINSNNQIPNPK